jgi:sugar phosphate permease
MIATSPLVLMVQAVGWRTTFAVFSGIQLLLTLLFWVTVRDRPQNPGAAEAAHPSPESRQKMGTSLRHLFQERDYWIISLTTFCRYGIFAAVQTLWAGPYLMKVMGLAPVKAGNIILLMAVGLLLGGPVCGWLSDAVFRTRKGMMMAGLSGMGMALIVLACLSPGTDPLVLGALFFTFSFFSGAGVIVYTHIKERMPLPYAGTAMTGVNFFTMIGAAAFLQGLSQLMTRLYPSASLGAPAFRAAFLFCAACLALTVVLYRFTAETIDRKRPADPPPGTAAGS